MLKEYATVLRRMAIVGDAGILIISFYLGYAIAHFNVGLLPINHYHWILPVHVFSWLALLFFMGLYRNFRVKSFIEITYIVFLTMVISFGVFSGILYMFRFSYISRSFVVMTYCLSSSLILLSKGAILIFLHYIRRKGYNYRNILLVGTGPRAQKFMRVINNHREFGFKVVGLIDREAHLVGQTINGYLVLGVIDDLPGLIKKNIVDEVVFVVPSSWLPSLQNVMAYCETEGVTTRVAVDLFHTHIAELQLTQMSTFPMLTFGHHTNRIFDFILKRLFDVVIAGVLMILFFPVYLVIAIVVKSSTPGPVFYVQERCGLNGRRFKLYKFRTMFLDADERKKELMQKNEMQGPAFKMQHDPRITPSGRWMRHYSLDELPQLWNVIKGDMSLVGPRPSLLEEVDQYDNWHRRRLRMRPGITCLWQIKGRNTITDFNQWAKLDLDYIDNWSFWLDIKILLKTIPVVVFGVGAK